MGPEDDLRLARLESQVAYLLAHLGIDPDTAAGDWTAAGPTGSDPLAGDTFNPMPRQGPVAGPPVGSEIPPQLADALMRGKLIDAIKIYRSMTGLGLKEAKAAVEGMARDMGMRV
jgi:Ribosomal protein L7/L12 C-terminal domain